MRDCEGIAVSNRMFLQQVIGDDDTLNFRSSFVDFCYASVTEMSFGGHILDGNGIFLVYKETSPNEKLLCRRV